MLKIKSNVDLKELEKHGFKRQQFEIKNNKIYTTEYRRAYFDKPDTLTSVIDETREIIDWCDAFTYDWGERESTLVDDLIKADLAEKIEE